ncbi:hypothetical protein [Janthinobacterium sp. RT4P48]|uniref:hypothetical protein n=1 Tax=Janthinobacterium sp. RT4P48 TaxID=3424188 RepID=UPI003F2126AB
MEKVSCNKAGLELMCPQRRFIDFEYAKADHKVVYMRPWHGAQLFLGQAETAAQNKKANRERLASL